MSTADPPAVSTAGVGLGYGIAIAVSILVLISTIMLASYACVRIKASAFRTARDETAAALPPSVVVSGLEWPAIESLPKIVLGESKRLPKPNNGPCSICLSEYKARDAVRCVPECNHCFHADCVDAWLRMGGTCPMCRSAPVATPLSELVPLALHPR
ncbi:hypothetical protein SAY87_023163 [Trapa incisa]|uniref:RING-type domain-containing protein n=1 Tax=Trapa incisa TaxID=236973 RepID=A0AAN7K5J0_9MYRT|nr:hypothetical protein SAY87_023163 [Trapa incisa]